MPEQRHLPGIASGHACRTCDAPLSGPLPAKCQACAGKRNAEAGTGFCACPFCRTCECEVCNGERWRREPRRCTHCHAYSTAREVPICRDCGRRHTTLPSFDPCRARRREEKTDAAA